MGIMKSDSAPGVKAPVAEDTILMTLDQLLVAWWRYMVSDIVVNIGSGNGKATKRRKPRTKPMKTACHLNL